MKKILILSAALVVLAACNSDDAGKTTTKDTARQLTDEEKQKALRDSSNFTTIQWIDSTTKDLGKLNKDQSVEITYRFRNTGNTNLIIEHVSAQCGCTIPEKPELPIAPGEEGVIKARFNGSGSGAISKQIYVKANSKPTNDHTLTFKGEIQQ